MITSTRIAAIIIHEDKLLMLKGKWYEELRTPWWKIDNNESQEECLQRELQEEINATIETVNFFKTYEWPSFYNLERYIIQHIYIVTLVDYNWLQAAHEIEKIVRLSKDEFLTKKYSMIPITQQEIIPDIINAKIR